MDVMELMRNRHSVRSYSEKKIEQQKIDELNRLITDYNKQSGLHMRFVRDDGSAFDSFLGRYGKFSNVRNFIVLAGSKGDDTGEKAGYFGEKLVLKAAELGLGTCWVGGTFSRGKVPQGKKEKLIGIISIGYPEKPGRPHPSKRAEEVIENSDIDALPGWFMNGIEAALLAPTAINQQKFLFRLDGKTVKARTAGIGVFLKVDLGIVKYHFELGAGTENFQWA